MALIFKLLIDETNIQATKTKEKEKVMKVKNRGMNAFEWTLNLRDRI